MLDTELPLSGEYIDTLQRRYQNGRQKDHNVIGNTGVNESRRDVQSKEIGWLEQNFLSSLQWIRSRLGDGHSVLTPRIML